VGSNPISHPFETESAVGGILLSCSLLKAFWLALPVTAMLSLVIPQNQGSQLLDCSVLTPSFGFDSHDR